MRRTYGFSILEVLVSMFILSLGLLGVAALIPVGKLALVETDKSDRGGACGRAALGDVESLRMLNLNQNLTNCGYVVDPLNLTSASGASQGRVGYTASISVNGPSNPPVNVVIPFAIDPLGVTCSPAGAASSLTMNLGGTRTGAGAYFPLPRLSLMASAPLTGAPGRQLPLAFYGASDGYISQKQALADRMFRWRDDVTLVRQQDWTPQPAPNGNRPNGVYLHINANGQTTSVDSLSKFVGGSWVSTITANDAALLPASNGAFSWFATVVPSPAEVPQQPVPLSLNPLYQAVRTFNVSVAVCYGRVLTQLQTPGQPDGEETINLTSPTAGFLGGGYAGGTIQLSSTPTSSQLKALGNVKNDQWVMLCGWNTDTNSSTPVPLACQWYRVVGNNVGSGPPYYLSLVGPDWNVNDPRLAGGGVSLVIVQGVIGVYTKTIQLNNDLIWNAQ